MAREKGWRYGSHFVPHDIRVREWTSGKTRIEYMLVEVHKRDLGKRVEKVADHTVADGIDAYAGCWRFVSSMLAHAQKA
jgi:hypothetical protein